MHGCIKTVHIHEWRFAGGPIAVARDMMLARLRLKPACSATSNL